MEVGKVTKHCGISLVMNLKSNMQIESIYDLPREDALEILRNDAKLESQSAEHEGIYISEERFFQSFLEAYEEDMKTLLEGGEL